MRNVYKKSNKITKTLKDALAPINKVLLTATPLQNTLLELYGLVSILDDQVCARLRDVGVTDFNAVIHTFGSFGITATLDLLQTELSW